ncbi:hypothetical protein N9A67_05595 [Rhodobacteraceae bacterium]|nr:hypothetical protein [Paracoccaceae bacterium]
MKRKIINFCIWFAAFLVPIDIFFTILANNKVKDENYFLEQNLKSAPLGSGYGATYSESCRMDAVFHVYPYKTCLIRRAQLGVEDWKYGFYIAGPAPIFSVS